MSYSSFKHISQIEELGVKVESSAPLFRDIAEVPVPTLLTQILVDNIPLALNINTEKARSEFIISPVLHEVRKMMKGKISLFSGIEFNVDPERNLKGFVDYLLSDSPDQIFLKSPVVCIVEAKNENIKAGYAQCMAEMVGAKLFNQHNGTPPHSIMGVVTTGDEWKFLRLQNDVIHVDYDVYRIGSINQILSILMSEFVGNPA